MEPRKCVTTHVKNRVKTPRPATFAVLDSNGNELYCCDPCLPLLVRRVDTWDGGKGSATLGLVRVIVLVHPN